MTKDNQIEIVESLDRDLLAMLKSKGEDYNDSSDTLSNFKQVSTVVKTLNLDVGTPEGYALMMCVLKIARLANLKKSKKEPNNESLLDSYKDLINYAKLAYLNELESQNPGL